MSHQNTSSDQQSIGHLRPDTLWKGLLDFFLIEFIQFFFPERVADKRITRVMPLDKEFTQLIPKAYQKTRYADKLVKVIFDQEETRPVHFHIEIQGYRDQTFSKRMYVYDYRIYDRYGEEVENLAIFDRPSALPKKVTFSRNTMRNKREMAYYYYKVWESDTAFLAHHPNPIAQALLAVKEGIAVYQQSDEEILAYKIRMVMLFLSKGYTEQEDQNLFIFVTSYVKFSDPVMEIVFRDKLSEIIPKKKIMSLVELFKAKQKEAEEYAMKRGWEKGIQKGVEQGLQQGMQQGLQEGMEKIKLQMVKNWLKSGAFIKGTNSYEDIAQVTGLSIEEVKQIHKRMKKD